ncbi:MAG: rhodanese-like domain-containing protein [Cypionkella sp.]
MFNFLRSAPAKPQMSLKDVMAKVAAGEVLLIDVRERGELHSSGTAKGSLHIPVSLIAMKADPKGPDFDKRFKADKPIAVFCASGGRSGMAAQALQRLGYDATNIGGFSTWVQAGGPVIRV